MKYIKEIPGNDFEKALSLTPDQVIKIRSAIEKAYAQEWHIEGPKLIR